MKGRKRFKRATTALAGEVNDGANINDFNRAKEQYMKRNNRSSYNWQFGERPLAASDHHLPDEAFQQLVRTVCNATSAEYIINFLKINEVDEFKRSIYLTLRDINTVLRNTAASVSTNT